MSPAPSPSGPRFAAALLPHRPPGARLARSAQSAAAEALLRQVRESSGIGLGASSKAHARSMAAAAVAAAGRVGVDVEFLAPGRAIGEIARFLLGEAVRDEAAAYRAFTFREAYFKAFQSLPDRALMRAVAATDASLMRLAPGIGVLHMAPAPDFVLTLVWTMDGAPVRISA
jgi:hypothetical protein